MAIAKLANATQAHMYLGVHKLMCILQRKDVDKDCLKLEVLAARMRPNHRVGITTFT